MADLHIPLQAALAERYTIERELGRGGMALVFLAQDRKHRRPVAIKVLRPELAAALGPERFLREIALAARLNHPHILALHDSGEAGGLLYYVMPYVAGESLRQRLDREKQLPIPEALRITRDVAEALDHAHQHGVLHRDIKPENILLAHGQAVVADFGIARAVAAAGGERLTHTGITVGTPGYMSPEQATGEVQLDGRSDVYSLGCMAYEMLAGAPPFTGATAQAVLARHLLDAVPPLRTVRPAAPRALDQAILRALAKVPADRYATAGDLARALDAAIRSDAKGVETRRRWWVGAAVTGGLAALVWLVAPRIRAGPALDAARFVVLPFQHRGGVAPELVNGSLCESLVYDALGRWTDLKRVNSLRVGDALARAGAPATLLDGVRLARALGAGLLIWGELYEVADTIRVRAALYDVAHRGEVIRESSIRLSKRGADLGRSFTTLADALVRGTASTSPASVDAMGTSSLAALVANEAGDSALASWDLALARMNYRRALEHDPAFPQANLSLALVGEWTDEPVTEWRAHAARALAASVSLPQYSRTLAAGLVALADSDYVGACRRYRELLQRDSLDFAAWFGLGECHAKDGLVVADPASRSGWRFRSSYHTAADAYRRALTIVPSAHRAFREVASSRLFGILYTDPTRFRAGHGAGTQPPTFGAFPELGHDTLAFTPRLLSELTAARAGPEPPGLQAALDHNRTILRGIAQNWVTTFPTSAEAWAAQALVLEVLGQLSGNPDRSALGAVRRARTLVTDSREQLRLGLLQLRLLVKLESLEAARRLADSLLQAWPGLVPAQAVRLAPVAALVGRARQVVELLQRGASAHEFATPQGRIVDVPTSLAEPAVTLYAYAVMGVAADSFAAIEQQVEQGVRRWAAPSQREATRRALLDIPAVFGFPVTGLRPIHRRAAPWFLMALQWAVAHADTGGVRRQLQELESARGRTVLPGAVAIESIYQEAWLHVAIHDTAGAISLLDSSLDGLPMQRADLLLDAQTPGALVRAMALRAELASQSGDTKLARRWANDVAQLWANADAALQPLVQRMRVLTLGSRH